MREPKRTVLWSATGQQANNTSIELTDSIDNYDEIWFYGSGTRTYTPCVITEYPVIPGVVNIGGPFFVGKWGSTDTWLLCNGTQMFLSGNSGYVASSFYFGKNNGSTAWAASLLTGRTNDIRPFKIIGINYKNDIDRTVVWSSTGVNLYNQDITLSETLNHFDNFILYSSGYETGTNGCYHAGKNIYQVQDASKVINAGSWAYSPWKYAQKHNLLIGEELLLKGDSGHIRSGFYWGMGNQTTAYAAGRWDSGYAMSALQPYKIVAYGRHPSYRFIDETTEGGSVSSNLDIGYSGDTATLTAIPASEDWRCSAIDITGATLTGNNFMFENSNVTASAGFEHSRELTLENGDHGVLSADKMTGFSGDVVTVDATTDEGWYLSAIDLTGAEATGFKFTFTGSDVTALGKYTDVGFPVTYMSDEHVHLTGDVSIFIPGSEGIPLQSSYDTYYRISGYDIENGTIENGMLYPTGPCTIRAIEKINYFTATGNWSAGSNQGVMNHNSDAWITANLTPRYALAQSITGDIPSDWKQSNKIWQPTGASAYIAHWKPVMGFTATGNPNASFSTTALCNINGSNTQSQTITGRLSKGLYTYSKDFSASTQGTCRLSAAMACWGGKYTKANNYYLANKCTGTWTATGIAP